MMATLAQALIADLGPDGLAALAERLAPYLPEPTPDDGRWLDTHEAAEYLGLSVSRLHKLTASRAIPFEQEGPGCRCYFKRSHLDDWRCRSN